METQFSVPNIKIRIRQVRYTYEGDMVHCFMTFEPLKATDPYTVLYWCGIGMNMEEAKSLQFKHVRANGVSMPKKTTKSFSESYLYDPTQYEYHGIARLKANDTYNLTLAKTIAYKKAFRQFVNFYYSCYMNLYSRIVGYSNVWLEQIAQLSDLSREVNNEIKDIVD